MGISNIIAHLLLLLAVPENHLVKGFIPVIPTVTRSMTSVTHQSSLMKNQPFHRQDSFALSANIVNDDEANSPSLPSVNLRMIGQSLLNQAIIGSTIWTGGVGLETLMRYATVNPVAIGLGVAGLLPLLAFSRYVETSESPIVAGLNLSTEMAVLRLFGSTPQPIVTLGMSAILGGITGLVEETVFRGQLLPAAAAWAVGTPVTPEGVILGAFLSTLVFAALHTNPTGFFKGGDAFKDNAVLFGFQMVTGSIFAALYLTTHNLAVPIVAHALYDTYTFYASHLQVTRQMEYAKTEATMPSARYEVEQKWIKKRGEDFVQEARQSFYLMDTNQDGELSRKELRIALFSYGIDLTKLESVKLLQIADYDESGAIDFGEFLEFIGPSGNPRKAIKNAILGTASV